jgi:hypothetical protein
VLGGIVGGVMVYKLYKTMYETYGPSIFQGGVGSFDPNALPPSALQALMGSVIGILVLTVVAIVGLILSIVATATNRGRVFGVIGIILGILAPIIAVISAVFTFAANYGIV